MGDSEPDVDRISAADFMPPQRSLAALRRAAEACRGCGLHRNATQTVFGAGLQRARLMLVGETPGDQEDLAGKPFVGPAGRLLDEALSAAGIERGDAYVTNVVKHFKWRQRGKRRLHEKPDAREIWSCLPWLEAELDAVKPRVLVCLGATAAHALIGPDFRVSRQHGEFVSSRRAPFVTATLHPSAILRVRDPDSRHTARLSFVEDLKRAGGKLGS